MCVYVYVVCVYVYVVCVYVYVVCVCMCVYVCVCVCVCVCCLIQLLLHSGLEIKDDEGESNVSGNLEPLCTQKSVGDHIYKHFLSTVPIACS